MYIHWALARDAAPPFEPPAPAPLPEQRTDGDKPPNPRTVRAHRAAAHRVVASHVTLANQAAYGAAEALRLPTLGEPAREAVGGLGERWLNAFVRIEDHPAVPHRLPAREG